MKTGPDPFEEEERAREMPLVAHLAELRDRLLRIVLAVALVFLALVPFSQELYTWLAQPLMVHLPEGTSMIATRVASPFLTPFKLTLVAAVMLAIPYIFHQIWGFVAPGLYRNERRLVLPLLVSSTVLFYLGVAFAYFVVLPVVFQFLTGVAPEGVAVMTDITEYLDFVLKMFFAFGLAFEVPVATVLLVRAGVVTPDDLAAKRPYIIVGAFVVGMLLTPPDVISQSLLAVPMLLLFELGLFFARRVRPREAAPEDEAERQEAPPAPVRTGYEEYDPVDDAEWERELDRAEADEAALEKGGEDETSRRRED